MEQTGINCLENESSDCSSLLRGLTDEQKAVVSAPVRASLLVAASPGAGKTHTLLARLAYLLKSEQLSPQCFLFVTFSRSGIEEARGRLEEIAGLESWKQPGRIRFGSSFQTLHSIGRRLVESAEASTLLRVCKRRPYMRVLSQAQRQAILREAIERYRRRQRELLSQPPSCPCPIFNEQDLKGLEADEVGPEADRDTKSLTDRLVREISSQIAERKAQFIPPPAVALIEETAFQLPLVDFVYGIYEKWLQHLNCVDFDDMIVMAVKLLDAGTDWPRLFPHGLRLILVDEFQDTSASQLRLLRALVQRFGGSISAAGDDDQCIYEWRQARPQFMTEFARFFPHARLLFLRQSFRCPFNIARCANALIQHNERRLPKSIDPLPGFEHIRVRIVLGRCFADEIAYLRKELVCLHTAGKVPWRDIAILCRIAQPLETLRSALKESGIPYAGADQVKTIATDPHLDGGLRLPSNSLERAWRESLIQASPLISMLLLLVNEFDLHLLDNACRAYAPSMHALTKACIGEEGQQRGGLPVMQVVRYMVDHAAEFFEGFHGSHHFGGEKVARAAGQRMHDTTSQCLRPGFKRASATLSPEGRPKLSGSQWKACRALLSVYERLLVHAREQGSDIHLERMVEAALELVQNTGQHQGWSMTNAAARLLRHLAQHIDAEAKAQHSTQTGDSNHEAQAVSSMIAPMQAGIAVGQGLNTIPREDPSLTSQRLFDALARRRRPTAAPQRTAKEHVAGVELSAEVWYEPLHRLLLTLQDVWQDGTRALLHTRQRKPIDAVAVSTMHNAKGREWPFVFILRAVHGACPLSFPGVDLEEERRVFYVGLTRAREQCIILASQQPAADDTHMQQQQQQQQQQPSSFIDELSIAHCERVEWQPEPEPRRKRQRQKQRPLAQQTAESVPAQGAVRKSAGPSRKQPS
jgi:superfamily I DNA/RNA helicase